MRTRKQEIGNKNIVGQTLNKIRITKGLKNYEVVEQLSKRGVNIDASGLSKIEGGHRLITDIELRAFSETYNISVNEIFKMALI